MDQDHRKDFAEMTALIFPGYEAGKRSGVDVVNAVTDARNLEYAIRLAAFDAAFSDTSEPADLIQRLGDAYGTLGVTSKHPKTKRVLEGEVLARHLYQVCNSMACTLKEQLEGREGDKGVS